MQINIFVTGYRVCGKVFGRNLVVFNNPLTIFQMKSEIRIRKLTKGHNKNEPRYKEKRDNPSPVFHD
jgi:hypothetical protein